MTIRLLDHAESVRKKIAPRIALKRKSEYGQFMTPSTVARFMTSLFPPSTMQTCRLLDAGAGVGALSCAFLDRWAGGDGLSFEKAEVEAYEIDNTLREHLEATLAGYTHRLPVTFKIISGDFIWGAACRSLQGTELSTPTNPSLT